jgi:hypothetical protein
LQSLPRSRRTGPSRQPTRIAQQSQQHTVDREHFPTVKNLHISFLDASALESASTRDAGAGNFSDPRRCAGRAGESCRMDSDRRGRCWTAGMDEIGLMFGGLIASDPHAGLDDHLRRWRRRTRPAD